MEFFFSSCNYSRGQKKLDVPYYEYDRTTIRKTVNEQKNAYLKTLRNVIFMRMRGNYFVSRARALTAVPAAYSTSCVCFRSKRSRVLEMTLRQALKESEMEGKFEILL